MPRYYYTVEVINTFKDTINVCVEAGHAGLARKVIQESMPDFPGKINHDDIKHCYVENREKVSTEVIGMTKRMGEREGL